MAKRVTGIYFTILLIGILYAIFAMFSFRGNRIDTRTEDKKVITWDDQMEMTQEGNTYYYKRILPLENMSEKVIVYNTVHMHLEVFIDRNKVYELKAGNGKFVKTTGFCWNTIPLQNTMPAKKLSSG